MQKRTTFLAVILWLSGCGSATDFDTDADPQSGAVATASDEQALSASAEPFYPPLWEHWSKNDDPAKLGNFEYRISNLPAEGEVNVVPWVGSYYPAYIDSINYRWGGPNTESAPHKYQRAFGGHGLEDAISRQHGVGTSGGARCTSNAQCSGAARCGRRAGFSTGRCTPLWWGICHAWAAAATLHPEPRHAAFYNGVKFEVADIKALLSIIYNTADTTQVSLRCQEPPGKIAIDRAMRPTGSACRDTNPGTYHVLLANLIGLQGKSFIEDRTIDRDVWNQPIRSYKVLSMHEVSAYHANRLLGISNGAYPYNSKAEHLVYVKLLVKFIKEARPEKTGYIGKNVDLYTKQDVYEYLLELDGADAIIGGEWLGKSKLAHPDFVWVAHKTNTNAVAGGRINVKNVLELARLSNL